MCQTRGRPSCTSSHGHWPASFQAVHIVQGDRPGQASISASQLVFSCAPECQDSPKQLLTYILFPNFISFLFPRTITQCGGQEMGYDICHSSLAYSIFPWWENSILKEPPRSETGGRFQERTKVLSPEANNRTDWQSMPRLVWILGKR